VAVHVDGDLPGAQKLGSALQGARLSDADPAVPADGTEITRLPGEADAPQVMACCSRAWPAAGRCKAVLADARPASRCRRQRVAAAGLLRWDTDDEQLVPRGRAPRSCWRSSRADARRRASRRSAPGCG
jgi:hypothetical protein